MQLRAAAPIALSAGFLPAATLSLIVKDANGNPAAGPSSPPPPGPVLRFNLSPAPRAAPSSIPSRPALAASRSPRKGKSGYVLHILRAMMWDAKAGDARDKSI